MSMAVEIPAATPFDSLAKVGDEARCGYVFGGLSDEEIVWRVEAIHGDGSMVLHARYMGASLGTFTVHFEGGVRLWSTTTETQTTVPTAKPKGKSKFSGEESKAMPAPSPIVYQDGHGYEGTDLAREVRDADRESLMADVFDVVECNGPMKLYEIMAFIGRSASEHQVRRALQRLRREGFIEQRGNKWSAEVEDLK